ncbi:kinase [Rosenbergiella collisarenosi]|uniref:host specificity factor TipJ family phage tail protein n=1 Tax=Rosenbergiella collisarenosi TaxID=1544695 RepID=UPI001BD96D65|nr:host specificity factor TipJ family phage tail protein [Rosenbergiella collisarenosi]MBT0720607.1 kinase [Rosenbergiella collisarenosi]
MTIRIYPSLMQSEPIEVHEHSCITIADWLASNIEGWSIDSEHPIAIFLEGKEITTDEWETSVIASDCNVSIYPKQYGPAAPAWLVWTAVVIAIASAAYSIYMMQKMGGIGDTSSGDQLDLNPAKANSAKLGDPIREIFGQYKVYPDYLVQPVSRFDKSDPKIYRTEMLLCLGVGRFNINQSGIRIGSTPISSFGDDATVTIYQPGADLSGDRRADNWYNSTEVGGTTSGTAGLDLASTGPSSVNVNASAIALSGNSITLIGETSSNEDDKDDSVIPDSWKEGSIITVEAPDSYTVASESGKTVIYGDFTELVPVVGMPVTAVWNDYSYDLFIAIVSKGSPAIPGQGGNAASITANAAPTTYDFSATALSFTLTWAGASYVISLTANYVTMQGLVDEITDQLTGSGLIATGENILLSIKEKNSPYSGNSIGYTVLPSAIFGNSPTVVQGVASSGGSPEVLPSLSLAYDSAKGPVFYGLPTGTQRISIGPQGNKYQITDIDGLTINVKRLIESDDGSTSIDNSWPGFTARTLLDASVTGTNDEYDWMGPFECCPDGEITSLVEMNFVFPSGLAHINKKGHIKSTSVTLAIQYRQTGGDWVEVLKTYSQGTVDEVGFTESFSLPNQSQYEFRVRRTTTPAGGSDRDSVQWQAMRAKLSNRPNRYADVTTMAVTVRTGNRLAAQSDRRINVVATRLYDGYPSRSISGALNHLLSTTDAQIDTTAINALEANYWTPRNETFDYSADSDSTSMLDILQKIATAGMGYFHLSDGLATVGREGVKNWSGVITPQETTEELTTAAKAPTSDDYDGVDVTYTNSTTWAEETVQCRTSDNPTPNKVESYKLDGVVTADRAYRIGMRRLMKYIYQRCTYSTSTELDALCYRYGDRVVMTDDIPGSNTISCLVVGMQYTDSLVTIETSERLDWTFSNPRVLFRLQDGSAVGLLTPTRVDDFTFTVPNSTELSPELWEMDSGSIEPPRVIFCSSESAGYDTLISEISPDADGTCQVTALSYDPKFYQHDDDAYPGNVS